jgi:chromate transporter
MTERVRLFQLVRYFLRLGTIGFGGPAALVAIMEAELVEQRKWLTRNEYLEGLAVCQTLPGPLAIQVGIYVGYVRGGFLGAWLAGGAFILPPFLIVLGSAYLYERFSALTQVRALFYGISPVVIALIVHSCYKLGKIALKDVWLWAICGVVAIVTAWLQAEIALLFIGAGILGIVIYSRRRLPAATACALLPVFATATGATGGGMQMLNRLRLFFLKAGSFTFGSGLVIVPFLREGVVSQQHWLNERDFMVAVAIGMITPGPVVITATFVGYVVAGLMGSVVATIGIFLPSFLLVTFAAPQLVQHRENRAVQGFVRAVSAAAVGAILGASIVLARLAIGDWFTAGVAAIRATALFRWRVPPPLRVGIAAAAGLVAFYGLRPTWLPIRRASAARSGGTASSDPPDTNVRKMSG